MSWGPQHTVYKVARYPKRAGALQREGAELGPACVSACRAACSNAVERYAAVARSTTGFPVADDAQARASRACSRECAYECNKPGKFYEFQISSRR